MDCFESDYFVGVVGRWGKSKQLIALINVYAPCDLRQKKDMWKELIDLKTGHAGVLWVISILCNLLKKGRGWKTTGDERKWMHFQIFCWKQNWLIYHCMAESIPGIVRMVKQ